MRNLKFTDEAWESYFYWQTQNKKTLKLLKRINDLIQATLSDPVVGVGKPEALKHSLSSNQIAGAGIWQRQ